MSHPAKNRMWIVRILAGLVTVTLAGGAFAESDTEGQDLLSCAYSHSIGLGSSPSIEPRSQKNKQFDLHMQDGKLAPEFCDEVIHSIATDQTYLAFCSSGAPPAKITHDIIINRASGEIVTIMTFFADLKWVTKLAQYGACDME